ncbi:hypothetical protein [Leclercia adecarboxylata]|uniref:hypothetical protein n=1 Tax=Leclercia adecarboxylata TaxID=83655 RepID=UPI0022E153B7|nr:hypothetical protein [Leclercia adecarboxylata]MDU6821309.1 hypothetical protein [Leclercia adecarboxylata]WJT02284.1 hypothetical protein OCT50_16995 [Leclercia adecarboxylata]
MKNTKRPVRKKVVFAISVACFVLGLIIIILPKDALAGPFMVTLCAAIGGLVASFFERKSNEKTEKIKEDLDSSLDILYTSRRVNKSHKVILMSKVERELQKIITDERGGKHVSLARKEVLLGLVKKYKNQGIVIDNEAVEKLIKYDKKATINVPEKDAEFKGGLRKRTVTQLFLVAKRQELFWAKNTLILATMVSAGLSYFFFPNLNNICVIPAVAYLLLFLKEIILTYRIDMGLFGANRFEAIQLLQYIEKNKDRLDLNGPGGRKRKVFKEISHEIYTLPVGGVEGICS